MSDERLPDDALDAWEANIREVRARWDGPPWSAKALWSMVRGAVQRAELAIPEIREARTRPPVVLTAEERAELSRLRVLLRDEAFHPEQWAPALAILDRLLGTAAPGEPTPDPAVAVSCRNYQPWGRSEDERGQPVPPRACYVCGAWEHEHVPGKNTPIVAPRPTPDVYAGTGYALAEVHERMAAGRKYCRNCGVALDAEGGCGVCKPGKTYNIHGQRNEPSRPAARPGGTAAPGFVDDVLGEIEDTLNDDYGEDMQRELRRSILQRAITAAGVTIEPGAVTVAEALRDPRVRAGTHWIEYHDPLMPDAVPPRGLVRVRFEFEAFGDEPGGVHVTRKQRYLLRRWSVWGDGPGFHLADLDAPATIIPASEPTNG